MDIREFTDTLVAFETTATEEAEAQAWFRDQLAAMGFETYEWTADAETLADHPSFPDNPAEIEVTDRPSVAGVLELGDPEAGPTLVINGHVDVVPADAENWASPPFDPTWSEDREELTGRGAVDMKSPLAAAVFAAHDVAADPEDRDLNGRIVVESVVGEEEGGIGAAAAALDNPYPFERDAALVAEPTDLDVITATEGTVMKELTVHGRSAHAATRWVGEDVLDYFETIRAAFYDLEAERTERCDHPLYQEFPIAAPVCIGTVEAGNWASSVASTLTAGIRIGVLPGETVDEVEAEYEAALQEVVDDSEWLSAHPPDFDRFTIQFEPAETDADEPVVRALQAAMEVTGLSDTEPKGATYGADNRHYVAAGIPTVLFGPGTIEQAHFPDETIQWADVEQARTTIAETARQFLGGE
jgi:acetylornithine deacetylase